MSLAELHADSSVTATQDDLDVQTVTWFLVNILLALVAVTCFFGFAGLITFAVAAAFLGIGLVVTLTMG